VSAAARTATVAIPVRDGGAQLEQTLTAVSRQQGVSFEVLVCDSGSRDGSVAVARRFGAEVISIPPSQFAHGGTRNLLMERAQGDYVAFLTQDAAPAGPGWLAALLDGFALADDVGLVFGPYRPRADASPMVARELTAWFESLSGSGAPRVDRLAVSERGLPARELLGARGYFTDANGCVARAAWSSVPFRDVPYAEDHALAHDMLRAGYAKVFMPAAAVIHSHDYGAFEWLRRSFDEARAVRELYGFSELGGVRRAVLQVRGNVGADWRWWRGGSSGGAAAAAAFLAASARHHAFRSAGTVLGARAEQLPPPVVRRLSLEGRR
jgi:rhamnosyltransferase